MVVGEVVGGPALCSRADSHPPPNLPPQRGEGLNWGAPPGGGRDELRWRRLGSARYPRQARV